MNKIENKCKSLGCKHYSDFESPFGICTQCDLQGDLNINTIASNCPYIDEFELNDKNIDWEQRRYEISKDILSSIEVNSNNSPEADCKLALDFADELIKQLKHLK